MTEIPPKFERMLKAQTVGSLLVGVASTVYSLVTCTSLLGWSFSSLFLTAVGAFVLSRIGRWLTTLFFQKFFYGNRYDLLLADAAKAELHFEELARQFAFGEALPRPVDLKILKMENRLGTFQDEPFYDWIEVLGRDGRPYRFNYVGCQDLSKGLKPVAKGCIIVPPGIIYQVDQPVNNSLPDSK